MIDNKIKIIRGAAIRAVLLVFVGVVMFTALGLVGLPSEPIVTSTRVDGVFDTVRGNQTTVEAMTTGRAVEGIRSTLYGIAGAGRWIVVILISSSLMFLGIRTYRKLNPNEGDNK